MLSSRIGPEPERLPVSIVKEMVRTCGWYLGAVMFLKGERFGNSALKTVVR
jgi:hypothetical protein